MITAYSELSIGELESLLDKYMKDYEDFRSKGLTLDMSRGKPDTHQLDLSDKMLDTVSSEIPSFPSTIGSLI